MNIFKAIGRMFTLPKTVRESLADNPIASLAKSALENELAVLIPSTVSKYVGNPIAAQAITDALGHAVASTGIFE